MALVLEYRPVRGIMIRSQHGAPPGWVPTTPERAEITGGGLC